MTISQNFICYHKSIGEVLKNSEQRIRDLIGDSHWLTDGEHKESILRKIIFDFSPEIYRIGSGFICYPRTSDNSGQIDILITSKMHPTLYKNGELHFVTPDCVRAIIEVKSKLTNGASLDSAIQKLSEEIGNVRKTNPECWAGLFIYESDKLTEEDVLSSLQKVTNNNVLNTINCVAIGEHKFIRYWRNGHSTSELANNPVWHGYELNELSQPYFISNLISHLSPGLTEETAEAWFPITGTKEINRTKYAMLSESTVENF